MRFSFCKGCGKCCTGPYISPREAKRLGLKGVVKVPQDERGKCIFFGRDMCTLDEGDVPLACRIYPLMPTKSWWVVRVSCPNWNRIDERMVLEIMREFERGKEDWNEKI